MSGEGEGMTNGQRALAAEMKLSIEQAVGPIHTELGEQKARQEAFKEDLGEVKETCGKLSDAVSALTTQAAVSKAVAKSQARRTAIPITVGGSISIGILWQFVKNAIGWGGPS